MTLRKFSFLCAVAAFVSMAGCSKTNYSSQKRWDVADDEIIYLEPPSGNIIYPVSGSIYKAIDPKYIANRNGITRKETVAVGRDGMEYRNPQKYFSLIAFNHYRYHDISPGPSTSLEEARAWNFYINDKLMSQYYRVLVSALRLQAIERVEYFSSDTFRYVALNPVPRVLEKPEHGAVYIYTRDISEGITPDRSTLYLLEDTILITKEIFEAINPVFIRSLQRITDKEKLADHNKKNIKEIVKIETFDATAVRSEIPVDVYKKLPDRPNSILLVNGIQMPPNMSYIFNGSFIKERFEFREGSKELSQYQEKLPGIKNIIFISL